MRNLEWEIANNMCLIGEVERTNPMTPTPPLTKDEVLEHISICPDGCGVCKIMAREALTAAAGVGRNDDVVVEGTKEGLDLFRKIERNHIIERCAQVVGTFRDNQPETIASAGLRFHLAAAIRALKDNP